MNDLDRVAWEILNATADDWENLEQIYGLVKAQEVIPLEAVADRVRTLVEGGLLAARLPDCPEPLADFRDLSYVWRAWFRMTPEGRSIWSASQHAAAV